MRKQEGSKAQLMRPPLSYRCCCCLSLSTHALHEEKHSYQCVLHLLSLEM